MPASMHTSNQNVLLRYNTHRPALAHVNLQCVVFCSHEGYFKLMVLFAELIPFSPTLYVSAGLKTELLNY